MKLNSRKVYPPNGTLCFAINNRRTFHWWRGQQISSGFVGVVLFEDGKWYALPDKCEMSKDDDFLWIELNNQPKPKQEDDIKHCNNCICNCECGTFDKPHADYCNIKR